MGVPTSRQERASAVPPSDRRRRSSRTRAAAVAPLRPFFRPEQLADIAFLDVPGRIARKVLELADRHGKPVADGVRIGIRVPQAELAAMVGASRENVNRVLAQFVDLGALTIDRGHITIVDEGRLRSMC